jgi:hypothetical protein
MFLTYLGFLSQCMERGAEHGARTDVLLEVGQRRRDDRQTIGL